MVSRDVLLLQETKISEYILLSTISKKWKSKIGMVMGSRGTAGGIATLWTKNVFTMEQSHITQHWLFSKLRHNSSQKSFCLFNLYVSVNSLEKRECWSTLDVYLAANSFSNIIVAGDLNIILNDEEKNGGFYGRDPMPRVVDNLILTWELIDFKPK